MKPFVGALFASLAGCAFAAAVGGQQSDLVSKRWEHSKVDMVTRDDAKSMFNLKFEAVDASYNSPQFYETSYGYIDDTINFINNLNFGTLQKVMGDDYGKPFRIDFYDYDNQNNYFGYISGYFTSDGSLVWDDNSQVPRGARLPNINRSPSLAPQTVVVTASGDQSNRIIQAGTITDADLHQLLGGDYGKPFRIILTGSNGSQVGSVSGSFSGSGGANGQVKVIFDSGSQIPKPAPIQTPLPPPPTQTVTVTPPAPTAAPPDTNTGSISIGGGTQDQITANLNNLDYNTILKATGGKYGNFYITFASADGRLQGYITGYIKSTGEYKYQWKYTITG